MGFNTLSCLVSEGYHLESTIPNQVVSDSSVCILTKLNMVFNVMVFYATMPTFRMTLMKEYTNIIMDDGRSPTFSCQQLVMKYCHG